MAIFSSLAERNRVFDIIEQHGKFGDISELGQAEINGIYEAIDELDNLEVDIYSEGLDTLNSMAAEIAKKTIEEAITTLEIHAAELYVYYSEKEARDD